VAALSALNSAEGHLEPQGTVHPILERSRRRSAIDFFEVNTACVGSDERSHRYDRVTASRDDETLRPGSWGDGSRVAVLVIASPSLQAQHGAARDERHACFDAATTSAAEPRDTTVTEP